jgi:HEAT repeat protein
MKPGQRADNNQNKGQDVHHTGTEDKLLATHSLSIPRLLVGLQSPERSVRLDAAAALGRLGPQATKAVPALIQALKDADVHVRKLAALALGDIGPAAVIAVPALVEACQDQDGAVRHRALVALRELGAEPALGEEREAA